VWLARNPWASAATLRGDAVFVAPGRLPRHLVAAYTLDPD
jgi:putative endonuclease